MRDERGSGAYGTLHNLFDLNLYGCTIIAYRLYTFAYPCILKYSVLYSVNLNQFLYLPSPLLFSSSLPSLQITFLLAVVQFLRSPSTQPPTTTDHYHQIP